ncbi:hypothetical protein [Priestia aryabhattai]
MSAYVKNLKTNSEVKISRSENEITLHFEDLQYAKLNAGSEYKTDRELTFGYEQFKRYVDAIIKVRTLKFVLTSLDDSFNSGSNIDVVITNKEEEQTITMQVESTDLIFNELELTTTVNTLLP